MQVTRSFAIFKKQSIVVENIEWRAITSSCIGSSSKFQTYYIALRTQTWKHFDQRRCEFCYDSSVSSKRSPLRSIHLPCMHHRPLLNTSQVCPLVACNSLGPSGVAMLRGDEFEKDSQTRILMCSNTHARYPQLLKGVEWYPKGTSGHGV